MPPKACPLYMRRLIDRLNQLPPSDPNPLKQLMKALQVRGQGKGTDTVTVKALSEVTINLVNSRVNVRSELELGLQEIDLSDLLNLIGECPEPTCGRLFWRGRADKPACDKHIGLLRQRRNRRDKKAREAEARRVTTEAEREGIAKRKKREATQTFDAMNRTAQAVIRAVMVSKVHKFTLIDGAAWHDFYDDDLLPRSTLVVRRVTHKLHKDGFLDYFESAERRDKNGFSPDDRYYPTQKLIDLWNDSRRPTH